MKKAALFIGMLAACMAGCKKDNDDRNQYTGVYEFQIRYHGNYDTAAVFTPFDTSYVTYGKVVFGIGEDGLLITNARLSSVMVTVLDDKGGFADHRGVVHGHFYPLANKMNMTFEDTNPISITEVVGYKQ